MGQSSASFSSGKSKPNTNGNGNRRSSNGTQIKTKSRLVQRTLQEKSINFNSSVRSIRDEVQNPDQNPPRSKQLRREDSHSQVSRGSAATTDAFHHARSLPELHVFSDVGSSQRYLDRFHPNVKKIKVDAVADNKLQPNAEKLVALRRGILKLDQLEEISFGTVSRHKPTLDLFGSYHLLIWRRSLILTKLVLTNLKMSQSAAVLFARCWQQTHSRVKSYLISDICSRSQSLFLLLKSTLEASGCVSNLKSTQTALSCLHSSVLKVSSHRIDFNFTELSSKRSQHFERALMKICLTGSLDTCKTTKWNSFGCLSDAELDFVASKAKFPNLLEHGRKFSDISFHDRAGFDTSRMVPLFRGNVTNGIVDFEEFSLQKNAKSKAPWMRSIRTNSRMTAPSKSNTFLFKQPSSLSDLMNQ